MKRLLLKWGGARIITTLRERSRRREWKRQGVMIARGSYVHPEVTIGRYTRINVVSHIGPCTIGAYCAIGGRLVVRSADHFTGFLNMQDWAQTHVVKSRVRVAGKTKGSVAIGNAVWIGDSVIVLPGATIGDGAVIGAGSVVTGPVPAFSIAAGNPARVLKRRFPQEVEEVVAKIKWWEWSEDKIRDNRDLFELDLSTADPSSLEKLLLASNPAGDD